VLIKELKFELVFTFVRDIIATRTLPLLFVPFGNIFPSWAHKVIVQEIIIYSNDQEGDRGGTVVKVLCYKLEGRWFDSR